MATRDDKGRFIKGKSGNPAGRKPRATEQEYQEAVKDAIPIDRFRRMIEKQAVRAERGDIRAFEGLCKLLGLYVEKREVSGQGGGPVIIKLDWSGQGGTDSNTPTA